LLLAVTGGGGTKMNTTQTMTSPVETARKPIRVLWKWSFFITAIVLAFFMWQCGSALLQGRRSSNQAVRQFHQELNAGEYELICQEASEGFTRSSKHDELIKFLQGVHTKLGAADRESLLNLSVNATTNGTFVMTRYSTTFSSGSAVETFTWIKSAGTLKLYGYNVQSNALFN
jgi:hypothetical protein